MERNFFDRMTGFSGDYRMGRRSLDRIYRIDRIGEEQIHYLFECGYLGFFVF